MKHFAKHLAAWALTLALVGSLTSPVTHAVTTSPTVIWLNPDGTLGGKTAAHSTAEFSQILEQAGYHVGLELPDSQLDFASHVLMLTNKSRMAEGLMPLSSFPLLSSAAAIRAQELVTRYDHDRPDGSAFYTVFAEPSINLSLAGLDAGENIASGQSNPVEVHDAWMNSPTHRANIMNPDFQHLGVGLVDSVGITTYKNQWAQLFLGGCTYDRMWVNVPNPYLPPDTPIEDLGATVILNCTRHGRSSMPLIEEMVTNYDGKDWRTAIVHYGDMESGMLEGQKPVDITANMFSFAEDVSKLVYTGEPIMPSIKGVDTTTTLEEGTDYQVTYSNNVLPGTAKVVVTGLGQYIGSVELTFQIAALGDVSTLTIENLDASYPYTGKAIQPAVVVKDGNKVLMQGQDYTVTYSENIGTVKNGTAVDKISGQGTLTITGAGGYLGEVSKTFTIVDGSPVKANGKTLFYNMFGLEFATRVPASLASQYSSFFEMMKSFKETGKPGYANYLKNLNTKYALVEPDLAEAKELAEQYYPQFLDALTQYEMVEYYLVPDEMPEPTPSPTPKPTATPAPTAVPTATPVPTAEPTATPAPTAEPTATPAPTAEPTATPVPTAEPTATPVAPVVNSTQPVATARPTQRPTTVTSTPAPSAAPSTTPNAVQFTAEDVEAIFEAQLAQPTVSGEETTQQVVLLETTDNRTQVSQTAFELLMEQENTTLRLEGDGFAWNFSSDDMVDAGLANGSFDAAITHEISEEMTTAIQGVTQEQPYVAFETAFSGQLPGKATLEMQLDTETYAGKTVALYYQPEGGEAEFIANLPVDASGLVAIPLEHCSVYFLTVTADAGSLKDIQNTPITNPDDVTTETAASTSFSWTSVGLIAMVLVALVVIVGFVIYSHNTEEE